MPSMKKEARILLSLDSHEAKGSQDVTRQVFSSLRKQGIEDILVVSPSSEALREVERDFPSPGSVGNDLGVRTWLGDVAQSLPNYLGPFDAALVLPGKDKDDQHMRSLMLRISLMLRPGSSAMIFRQFESKSESRWWSDLPLVRVEGETQEEASATTILQVPQYYELQNGPVFLEGAVVTGFGRGSRKMGIPTANLDPKPLADKLVGLPNGVYFGWAQLDPCGSEPSLVWVQEDREKHKMVMNVGRRPTVSGDIASEQEVSVEAHILHKFPHDFYGCHLRVVATGYLRPEMKFQGISQLVSRIKADIAISTTMLEVDQKPKPSL